MMGQPGLAPDFRPLFEAVPTPLLVLLPDDRFTIVAASDAYLRATLTTREGLLGRGLFEAFPDNPDDPGASGVRNLRASLGRVLATGAPDRMAVQKYDIPRPGGGFEERHWSPLNTPVLSPAGEITHVLHHVEDVTESVLLHREGTQQKLVEAALRETSEWFSTTLNSIGDAVIATDLRGRVTFMNGVAAGLTKWGAAEAAGRPLDEVFRIVNEATREVVESPVEKILREGHVVGLANRTVLVARDGTERPIEDSAAPIRSETGAIAGVVLVFHDATEKRRAEKALAESEEFCRRVIASSPDCLKVLDLEGRLVAMNEAGCRVMEIDDFGPCVSRDWAEFWPEESREEVRAALATARGGKVATFRGHAPTAKGTWKWWDVSVSPVLGAGGEPIQILSVSRDITERVEAEARLHRLREQERAAEQRTRTVLESISDAFFALGGDWRFTYVNPQAEEILGREPGDLLGKSIWEEYPGLVGSEFERAYRRTAAERVASSVVAYYPDHDRWYEVRIYAAADGISIYFRDVSERERSAEMHRRLDERRRLALDTAGLGSFNFDPATEEMECDERFREIFGLTEGRSSYRDAVANILPEDRGRVFDAIAAATRPDDPRPYAIEYRVAGPDGTVRWVAARGRMNVRGEGAGRRLASFDGTVADITDRKRDEEALRSSEERYRTLFETMAEGFCVVEVQFDAGGKAVDYRFLEMNPAFERHTGLSGMIGKSMREAVPDLDAFWYETYGRVAATGEPARFVSQAEALGGRWFDVSATRVAGPGSRKVAILFNDITARVRAEEGRERLLREVEIERERLAEVFQRAPSFMCVLRGPGHVFERVNDRYYQLVGHRDLIGRPVREAVPEAEGQGFFELLDAVYRTGEPFIGEGMPIRLRRRPGDEPEERSLDFVYQPLRDADGAITGILAQGVDLTERKRAEEALRENDRRKDEFLAMLAHELRNPLAAIGNAVTLTTRSGRPEHVAWSMDVIVRQMKHLTHLIDDLLDVSRINRGKIDLRRDVLDLTPIVDSAAATVRPLVEERKHTLDIEIDRGNLWADVDPTRLEQVVVNLLNNAAKYSDNRGYIRLSARNEGDEVVLSVKDRGHGFVPEKLPEMFELFAQGDRSLARSEGGLGIGLTVVKKLVEMHGGAVEARSEGPNRGSEFTVRLRRAERPAASMPPGPPAASGEKTSARILVVDDSVDTARGMARLLKLLGHDVAVAHSGPEGIEAAREHRPEFILLDIGLPGMDGYEAASRLRREEGSRDAILIAVSGYGQEEDRRRSKEAGFDHHLIKPVDHDALIALLCRTGDDLGRGQQP